jgi:adenylate kinase
MAKKIVLMGVQGSGKGTQSKMLAASLGVPHISTGDLFRANISQGTELGKRAQRYTDKGQLVPDAIVIDMVADRITQDDARGGFILDGFPRSAVQLAAIEYIEPIDAVVLLELDDQTAIGRLGGRSECPKCGILYGANRRPKKDGACDECGGPLKERADDKDVEAIKSRLDAYHREVQTLVDYYEWKGALKRVDGAGTADEVAAAIKKAVTS